MGKHILLERCAAWGTRRRGKPFCTIYNTNLLGVFAGFLRSKNERFVRRAETPNVRLAYIITQNTGKNNREFGRGSAQAGVFFERSGPAGRGGGSFAVGRGRLRLVGAEAGPVFREEGRAPLFLLEVDSFFANL